MSYILQKRNLGMSWFDVMEFKQLEEAREHVEEWTKTTKMNRDFVRIVQLIE